MTELFIESVVTSFTNVADDMPGQGIFDTEVRPKLIHSVGLVAEGSFISNGQHNYTGVFKGADNIILRISTAR